MFWGDYEGGGELRLEDGTVYSENMKWHGPYNGADLEHWVHAHENGTRFFAVAYKGPPAPKTRPPGKKECTPK